MDYQLQEYYVLYTNCMTPKKNLADFVSFRELTTFPSYISFQTYSINKTSIIFRRDFLGYFFLKHLSGLES